VSGARSSAAAARPRALVATLLAALGLLVGFVALVGQLTRGFEYWTFEALRRDDAARARLLARPVALSGPYRAASTPWPGQPGEVFLVDFIYTRCPTVCSALGAEYTRMQRALRERFGSDSPIRLVSIAFDRAHDTPAALRDYGIAHRQAPELWQIGTPVDAAAQDALLRSLGVVAVPDGMGGFVHNGAIHLIDAGGTVRGIYDLERWPQALERALALAAAGRS
jgi:protein SCO1/2